MQTWLVLALFFAVVLISHYLEGITGFGSTALSIPFLSVLLGIEIAKPVLILYTLFLCLFILVRSYRDIDWKHLGIIVGVAALGLPIGLLIYNSLPKSALLALLALFMIFVSVRGLLLAFGLRKREKAPGSWPMLTALFLGGLIQGAFASGGPLFILYSAEKLKDKSRFRATMCMVWVVLDSVLIAQMLFAGQLGAGVWKTALVGTPVLILGTVLGDIAHRRVSDGLFTKLTYGILLLSGVFTLFNL
jgi:uncharacterized membrane protein YfcA